MQKVADPPAEDHENDMIMDEKVILSLLIDESHKLLTQIEIKTKVSFDVKLQPIVGKLEDKYPIGLCQQHPEL